jgi:large subunit ribosomal protein L25
MTITDVVHVQVREARGTRLARRLRANGQVPAVLYGHGEETVSLVVPKNELEALLRHGGRVVELQGAVSGSALLRDVQWDPFGVEVLHLDLARVRRGETVEMTIPVELRGDAPGTHEGGVVEHLLHELEIRCPVTELPERIRVNINHLELGQHITVAELDLPPQVEPLSEPTAIVVQCVQPKEVEEVEAVAETAEPEVIGRKETEEEESE